MLIMWLLVLQLESITFHRCRPFTRSGESVRLHENQQISPNIDCLDLQKRVIESKTKAILKNHLANFTKWFLT